MSKIRPEKQSEKKTELSGEFMEWNTDPKHTSVSSVFWIFFSER